MTPETIANCAEQKQQDVMVNAVLVWNACNAALVCYTRDLYHVLSDFTIAYIESWHPAVY